MKKTPITPDICRAGRALVSLTQRELADDANVAPQTVADFERGARTPHANNIKAIAEVLERRGVEFVFEADIVVGVKKKRLALTRE